MKNYCINDIKLGRNLIIFIFFVYVYVLMWGVYKIYIS